MIVKRWMLMLAVMLAALLVGVNQKTDAKAGSLSTRGVWVSCFDYEDLGLSNVSESEFRKNANTLFYRIKANGCNTVYFHVRSYDDAIYPSEVVGWSKKLSKGGKALSYDPLEIVITYAHKYGLKFHAWMNPYRVTKKKVLDPGKEKTTERIVAQVSEIIENYKVDGIHFDDYFYPTNEKKYKKVSRATRMKNVNQMVEEVYATVKEKSKKLQFGISPAGNIDYCKKIGADVETWLSEDGYVDYIVPQIYWSDNYILEGEKTKLFTERLKEWREINVNDVPMYIGLALYKAGYRLKEDPGWTKTSKNIVNQLNKIKNGNTEGYVLFAYVDLYQSHASKEVKNYLAKITTLSLNCSKKTLRAGKTYRLKATASLKRVQNAIKWKSANRKVATVSKNGTVKAKKKGKTKIYAYYGSKKKSCQIRVK